jgi:hypothetical protein
LPEAPITGLTLVTEGGGVVNLPAPKIVLPQMNQYRRHSLKNVGRDADGKTIKYHYSEETAQLVAQWAASGADENYICFMLNMRPGTLKELYGEILEHASTGANMQVAGALFRDALQQNRFQEKKFWLKARAGWKDGENAAAVAVTPLQIVIHE